MGIKPMRTVLLIKSCNETSVLSPFPLSTTASTVYKFYEEERVSPMSVLDFSPVSSSCRNFEASLFRSLTTRSLTASVLPCVLLDGTHSL